MTASRAGQIRWLRLCAGWTQKDLAAAVGCDEVTIWKWETGHRFDTGLRNRGVETLHERLARLGFEAFTAEVAAALKTE